MYKSNDIAPERKIIYNWEQVYIMKKLRNKEDAEKYKIRVEKEIAKYGVNSEYIQTQYYCSFNVAGDRFITIEKLNSCNVFKNQQYGIDNFNLKDFDYIIASFDSARYHDYAGLLLGGIKKIIDESTMKIEYYYTVFEFRIFNEDKKQLSPDDLSIMVSDVCQKYPIDMIIYDTTAQQIDRAYYLQKEFDKRKIKTFIVPLNYSNKKMYMFQSVEDALLTQKISIPDQAFTDVEKSYDEFVSELLYLKKIRKENGKFDYEAPKGEMFKDDLVMIFAQFIYLPTYIKSCLQANGIVTQNISTEYNKPINFYKLSNENNEKRAGYYRR